MKKTWKGQRRRTKASSKAIAIRMPERLIDGVRDLAKRHDTTQAAVLREAVEQFIEKEAPPAPAPVAGGLFE